MSDDTGTTIRTRYKVGDEVWSNDKTIIISPLKISGYRVTVWSDRTTVEYYVRDAQPNREYPYGWVEESNLYPTREAILAAGGAK